MLVHEPSHGRSILLAKVYESLTSGLVTGKDAVTYSVYTYNSMKKIAPLPLPIRHRNFDQELRIQLRFKKTNQKVWSYKNR